MSKLSPTDYRDLLRASLSTTVDADTIDPSVETLFTPDNHRLALDPDVTVVTGARGVGKTVWHKALQDNDLRGLVSGEYQLGSLRSVTAAGGYGSERSELYPGPAVLRQLLAQRHDPVDIWTSVLMVALRDSEVTNRTTWSERVRYVHDSPERLDSALVAADRSAASEESSFLLLFDALDRLSDRREVADELVGGILRRALDLRLSFRHLRAKIFIRPDMFASAHQNFPDASKLAANSAELVWSNVNLYGLLYHQLGNSHSSRAMLFRQLTGKWSEVGHRRWRPPREVTGDRDRQQDVFIAMAGPYMGRDHRKGHTYQWLPNHLMDGAEQVSPRSFLSALAKAAEITVNSYEAHEFALHYDGIRTGVQEASKIRAGEIAEDMPWVAKAIGLLGGSQVPIEADRVAQLWDGGDLFEALAEDHSAEEDEAGADDGVRTGPRSRDADGLITELMALGVMTRRRDGRVDLPDVYRIAFNIGRKGGVPRVPASR